MAAKGKPIMADKSVSTTGLCQESSSSDDGSSSSEDTSMDLINWKAFLSIGEPLALGDDASSKSTYFEEWKKSVSIPTLHYFIVHILCFLTYPELFTHMQF